MLHTQSLHHLLPGLLELLADTLCFLDSASWPKIPCRSDTLNLFVTSRVCCSLGIVKPTEVQQGCIPAILAGKDVLGTAHTGSGKTAAFALPILQKLAADPFGVFALVLTPTR